MNGAARRCREQLEALGFRYDADRSTRDQSVWTHPAAPDEPVKVYRAIKDEVATVKIARARQIAGLASTGDGSDTVRDRARIRRQNDVRKKAAERLAHDRALAPYQAAADERVEAEAKRHRAETRQRLVDAVEDAREQVIRAQQRGHDPTEALRKLTASRANLAALNQKLR